jgi:hypothetical protein
MREREGGGEALAFLACPLPVRTDNMFLFLHIFFQTLPLERRPFSPFFSTVASVQIP